MKQKNTIIGVVSILIIIVAAVLGIFLYNKEHKVNEHKEEVKELVKEIASIGDFKKKLEEKEIKIESETENKECELIGASEGVTYKIEGKIIQVYKFDLNKSDELTVSNLKKAQDEGKVVMPSFNDCELKVIYNKGLVLINVEGHPKEAEIVEVFRSL